MMTPENKADSILNAMEGIESQPIPNSLRSNSEEILAKASESSNHYAGTSMKIAGVLLLLVNLTGAYFSFSTGTAVQESTDNIAAAISEDYGFEAAVYLYE